MSGQDQVGRYTRARNSRQVLDVDLNVLPLCETQEGTSFCSGPQPQDRQASEERSIALPPAIDLEAFDDDVIISSPTAFAQAKNNSRRNHGRTIVVDVDSEERSSRNKRRKVPTNQAIINCELCVNLEDSSSSVEKQRTAPPLPKEPPFRCPVCMGSLVEETSTKCGHIFCKACIKTAIAVQRKCPTCRKKTTVKELIRIYLPATGNA